MNYTLITGATGVLGRAFTFLLASRGEPLFLTGRSEKKLLSLVGELKKAYPELNVRAYPAELSSVEARRDFFRAAEGVTFSRLIYVAGADIQKSFADYTEEKLTFQVRANFEGAVSFVKGVLNSAPLDGNTELLAIGSVSGIYPMPYFALYSATKRALWQFFQALHVELKGKAKVTCVLPGAIPTREDVKEYIKTQGLWGKLAALPPEKVAKKSLKAVRRNRRSVVLGFFNKLMRVATAPVPLSLKMKFIAKKWKKTTKDAF